MNRMFTPLSAVQAATRYLALFQHSRDTITLLSPEGIVLEANPRWEQVLGIPPAQMVGRHLREFAAPGSEAANLAGLRSGQELDGHLSLGRLVRADGEVVQVEFSISSVELDGTRMVIAIGRDVSEQTRAVAALAEARDRYRELVERIPEVIWSCEENGKPSFITQNLERVTGFTDWEICACDGEHRLQGVHPADLNAVEAALRETFKNGRPLDIEYRLRHADGRWIWVRNRSVAIYERGGRRFVEGMLSDITEKRTLEEAFRTAQKMEAIGQLTGGIAHDFNNLLAVILSNVHFLIDGLSEQDPRRSDAYEIRQAAERAATLTKQLLAFSRHTPADLNPLDLNATFSGLLKMLGRLIGEEIEFCFAPGKDLGAVRADTGQIEQVIMNLVVNARDAMPRGGKLTLSTEALDLTDPREAARLSATPGTYVVTTVADTGTGMDELTRSRLFEPFFTTKEMGKGTGLGLSTCYGIVRNSGGFISAETEPGRGSSFKVHLPRLGTPLDQPRAAQPQALQLGGTETVLLIEDDDQVRSSVARILGTFGYRVL